MFNAVPATQDSRDFNLHPTIFVLSILCAFALSSTTAAQPSHAKDLAPSPGKSTSAPMSPSKNDKNVTIEFPVDRSMGKLYKLDLKFPAGPGRLPPSMEARGKITIPASCKLQLALSYQGAADLSPLKKITADNIYMIEAGHVDNFSDKGLEYISELPSVKVLNVDDTDITEKGMHSIGTMTRLITLSMQQVNLPDSALSELKHLKNLRRLRVDYDRLNAQTATYLRELVKLEYLNLSNCSVNNEMLQNIKPLKQLHTLHLSDNKLITNRGIECLTDLPIYDLDLLHTSVTSACGKSLKNMKSLQSVSVTLPETGRLELAKQLPNCRVSGAAGGPIPVEVFAPLK